MSQMLYATLEHVKQPVSKILFGTAIPSMLAGENADALLDAGFAAGLTTFDTARVYQQSERVLGGWLARRGLRDKVVLLSKGAHYDQNTRRPRVTPGDIRDDLAVSLRELQTAHIDIYLLHRDDPAVEVGPLVETLNGLRAEGKISAFGGSNWSHRRIQAANEYAYRKNLQPFTVSSPNFGLATQTGDPWGDGLSITGAQNREARAWYQEHQMPIIAYSSLGRGLFSGKIRSGHPEDAQTAMDSFGREGYANPENFEKLARAEQLAQQKGIRVPQVAMAWLFCQPLPAFSVLGTSNPARFAESIEALHIPLTPQEVRWLNLEE